MREVPRFFKSGHILIILKSLYFLCQIWINARISLTLFYLPEVIMLKRWWFTMIHPLPVTMRCWRSFGRSMTQPSLDQSSTCLPYSTALMSRGSWQRKAYKDNKSCSLRRYWPRLFQLLSFMMLKSEWLPVHVHSGKFQGWIKNPNSIVLLLGLPHYMTHLLAVTCTCMFAYFLAYMYKYNMYKISYVHVQRTSVSHHQVKGWK